MPLACPSVLVLRPDTSNIQILVRGLASWAYDDLHALDGRAKEVTVEDSRSFPLAGWEWMESRLERDDPTMNLSPEQGGRENSPSRPESRTITKS